MHLFKSFPRLVLAGLVRLSVFAAGPAPVPEWIWHPPIPPNGTTSPETVFFRKTFRTPPLLWNSRLTLSADDRAEVFLNGVLIARCERWDRPIRAEVTVRLNQGENVLAVRAENREGSAGLLVHLNLGGSDLVVSDSSWLASVREEPGWSALTFNAAHWRPVRTLGPLGMDPWGDILFRAAATPPESISVLEGFRVELIRSAEPDEGSWICMAFDPQGRLILSPQGSERPLLRLTLSGNRVERVEPVQAPIRYAMGLLFAHDSLYANAMGPQGMGLYRLKDSNGNSQFETNEVHLLKGFSAGSEHGYHAVALGPDGKIYVLNGNSTKPPPDLSPRSPYRHYGEDMLASPGTEDASEEDGVQPPAGYVLRTDPEGKEWELWMAGLRNAYGFDFNPEGELFTFDSDMEWDWGTPWYRPTRILHGVSGGEYGWRDGIRLWPEEYEDSLPAVVNIGIGSPTGVQFGTRSRFPEKYRRALFVQDWSYGRILAVHLEPQGASYTGTFETFLQGRPLNLTSLAFGPDGAMYFITGGRGTQSGLYRVSYIGDEPRNGPRPEAETVQQQAEAARTLRRRLERYHTGPNPEAVDEAWRHLGHPDRAIRFAARIALEAQPVDTWRDRLRREGDPVTANVGLIAFTRAGRSVEEAEIAEILARFPFRSLPDEQKQIQLRAVHLWLIRHGPPSTTFKERLIASLDPEYPAASWPLNRELSRILAHLKAPGVVAKTLALIRKAATEEEELHYVGQLRFLREGWSLDERREYFGWWQRPRDPARHPTELLKWFADVGRSYVDGAWIDRYFREFRRAAVAGLTEEERSELADVLETPIVQAQLIPPVPRAFVREWKMTELVPFLTSAGPRDLERGRRAFADAQCLICHRFGNDGGALGPELTAVASKYQPRDILESILEPSKVISEQYQHTTVILADGDSVTGRLIRETEKEVVIETNSLSGIREEIPRGQIREIRPALFSPMPEGLVNVLTRDEILDLLAYLQSGGAAPRQAASGTGSGE